jgi:hypothetical protein
MLDISVQGQDDGLIESECLLAVSTTASLLSCALEGEAKREVVLERLLPLKASANRRTILN